MLDINLILIIVALTIYISLGVIFKYRWFYYMCVFGGYIGGLITGAIGLFIILV